MSTDIQLVNLLLFLLNMFRPNNVMFRPKNVMYRPNQSVCDKSGGIKRAWR